MSKSYDFSWQLNQSEYKIKYLALSQGEKNFFSQEGQFIVKFKRNTSKRTY